MESSWNARKKLLSRLFREGDKIIAAAQVSPTMSEGPKLDEWEQLVAEIAYEIRQEGNISVLPMTDEMSTAVAEFTFPGKGS